MELIIGLLVVMTVICVFVWTCEKVLWNKGICKKNKLPWLLYKIDIQGGRYYKAGDNFVIITWPFIDGK